MSSLIILNMATSSFKSVKCVQPIRFSCLRLTKSTLQDNVKDYSVKKKRKKEAVLYNNVSVMLR